jgi:Protein of unknown function (DUF1207)
VCSNLDGRGVPLIEFDSSPGSSSLPLKAATAISPLVWLVVSFAQPGVGSAAENDANAHGPASAAEVVEPVPGRVFEPLQAAVRWPRFEASYLSVHDGVADTAGIANMGATLPLLGSTRKIDAPRKVPWDTWEIGLQAGVFALFDLDAPSQALVNADYLVGPYLALRRGAWSGFARLYHQSSHLGDEYLDQHPEIDRESPNWELLELLTAYDVREGLRVYGGGGVLVHRSPSGLDRGQVRVGADWRSRDPLFWRVRPVGALDISWLGRGRWQTNVSVQLGVEVSPSWWQRARLQCMAEYYGGSVPDGQFRRERTDRVGIGIQLWL